MSRFAVVLQSSNVVLAAFGNRAAAEEYAGRASAGGHPCHVAAVRVSSYTRKRSKLSAEFRRGRIKRPTL